MLSVVPDVITKRIVVANLQFLLHNFLAQAMIDIKLKSFMNVINDCCM